MRYEPSLLPADSVRCGQGQDSPQQRSLQQHNCGAEGERATPHISISSPTPAVEHWITTTTLCCVCVSVLVLVKPTHACFRTNTSSSSTPEPGGGAYCLLTSHNTTAQFRSRRQTQRQLGLLYVTTFHFYIAKYVASSGGVPGLAREQPNIFCPHP